VYRGELKKVELYANLVYRGELKKVAYWVEMGLFKESNQPRGTPPWLTIALFRSVNQKPSMTR